MSRVTFLTHNRVQLALHLLRDGEERPLLHLHGLGEQTPTTTPPYLDAWPGPVYGLDFTGHGQSTITRGGGYTAEVLMADADCALRSLGAATLFGRGLGAYVALLLAGARPDTVRGAILFDGPGIFGSGAGPGSSHVAAVDLDLATPPDPYVFAELAHDIRPPDYAASFARLATQASPIDPAIVVASVVRPDWLAAVVPEPGVAELPVEEALARYATPNGPQ